MLMEIVDNKALRKSVSNHKLKCTVLLFFSHSQYQVSGPRQKRVEAGDYVRLQNNTVKSGVMGCEG